jgi:hypothetical protein
MPSNPAEQRIWDRCSDEIKALVANAPPLSPDQIREIRGIWLSVITKRAQ